MKLAEGGRGETDGVVKILPPFSSYVDCTIMLVFVTLFPFHAYQNCIQLALNKLFLPFAIIAFVGNASEVHPCKWIDYFL